MIIAIDGPAGTGKGTVAKIISEKLNFTYIDTGAMYRCITLKMIRDNIQLNEIEKIKDLLNEINITFKNIDNKQKVLLDGEDVSELIRKPNVNELVSPVSAIKEIRIKMVDLQRKLGEDANVIMEGRDITTVVFPNADIKIYLDADLEVRAKRRYNELIQKGNNVTYEETLESIAKRDKNDMEKEMGALKIAEDAVVIDTTYLTPKEVFDKIKNLVEKARENQHLD